MIDVVEMVIDTDMQDAQDLLVAQDLLMEMIQGKITPAEQDDKVTDNRDEVYNPVHNPSHYQLFPDAEVVDVIMKILTPEEFRGYCKGNSLKYRLRAGKKTDTLQDLEKAGVYETWLREEAKGAIS